MATKSKWYVFTYNNYTDELEEFLVKNVDYRYLAYSKEIAPTTGTPHLQGWIYFGTQRHTKAVRKYCEGWWVEIMRGSIFQNDQYCSKEGTEELLEFGDKPQQGARTDLKKIRDRIAAGESVDELILNDPGLGHCYGRTMDRLEDIVQRNKFRTEMTEGIWYWGPTDVGKSHRSFEGYAPNTHYNVPVDGGWWDNYRGQETVIINDFRGEIPYAELLKLLDKWPHEVRRRNRPPTPFTSKLIIITSSMPPEKVYWRRDEEDNIAQLLRRLQVRKLDMAMKSPEEVI